MAKKKVTKKKVAKKTKRVARKVSTLYYYCPKCDISWDTAYSSEYGECDDECGECGCDYSPFNNKKERDTAEEVKHQKRVVKKAPVKSTLTPKQKLAIKSAFTDLIGSYQNETRGGGHNFEAQKVTIKALAKSFSFLDPITDELDECVYCGGEDCELSCDESQAGGFNND